MRTGVAVLIMAKVPRPGRVKTRLEPLLGRDGCARLQEALIRRTVRLAQQVSPAGCYLALDCPQETAGLVPGRVRVLRQRGAHLGERMAQAVDDVLADRPGPVLVIGTDAPTLTARHLRAAAERLDAGADVVFGPALDGGYYLIGLRRSTPQTFSIDPGLWGGPDVLRASVIAAEAAGLRTALVEAVRDLDTPEDMAAFLREGELSADIAEVLTSEVVRS